MELGFKDKERTKYPWEKEEEVISRSDSMILDAISDNNPLKLIKLVISYLKLKYGLSIEEILTLFTRQHKIKKEDLLVPATIFSSKLSPAEALVKYLKENKELRYSEIAKIINRDDRSIWGTYNRASTKLKEPFSAEDTKFLIPISLFKNRDLSILENVVLFLRDNYGLDVYRISKLLNKNNSTIWSVWNRVKKKEVLS